MEYTVVPARSVPVIPVRELVATSGSRAGFLEVIDSAVREFGFLLIDQDWVAPSLLEQGTKAARAFFALPQHARSASDYSVVTQRTYGNAGYYPFRLEQAVTATEPDLKEFFHVGRELPLGHRLRALYADNPWPTDVPEFRELFTRLYSGFCKVADILIVALGDILGIPSNDLVDLVADGNSIIRVLHYPPIEEPRCTALRAHPHTGINLLGLQPPSTHSGLQFYSPASRWIMLDHMEPTWMTVNIGEMWEFISSGAMRATLHRVLNETGGGESSADRYTTVFFYHPDPTKLLTPVQASGGPRLAGDWLVERLAAIRMKP